MSRTSAEVQPLSVEPDADAPFPNFDQWTNPALQGTMGAQTEPEIISDELDIDLVPGDPAPIIPFVVFVGAGRRRLGEIGHWVRRLTKGKACSLH